MTELEEAVREAWQNAYEGGYEQFLTTSSAVEVATDMMDCDSEVERIAAGNITAVIRIVAKLQSKGLAK